MIREQWLKIRRKFRWREAAVLLHVSKKIEVVMAPGGVLKRVPAAEGTTFSEGRNRLRRLARSIPDMRKHLLGLRRERQLAGAL